MSHFSQLPGVKSVIGLGALLWAISPTALADNIVGDQVILRTLDKVTATTQDYTVDVGDSLTYGTLTVNVRHCEKRPPEEIPETFTFLQIDDNKTDLFSDIVSAHSPDSGANDGSANDGSMIDGGGDNVNREPAGAEDGQVEPERIFSGWMVASTPAISALEHPVYDIWVVDCKTF